MSLKIIITTFFVVFIFVIFVISQIPLDKDLDDTSKSVYKALEAGKKGDFVSAVTLLETYLDFFQYAVQERLIYRISVDAQNNILTKGNARHLFRVINKGYSEGIQNSIEGYHNSVNDNPDYLPVYLFRGYWYEMYDYYDEALSDYNRAIDLEPENHIGYFYRGKYFKRLRKFDKAISDFEISIELDSLFMPAYDKMMRCFIEIEQFEEAIRTYEGAIKINPESKELFGMVTNAYRARGKIRLNKEKYQLAISDFTTILEMRFEDDWHAYTYRGVAFRKLKKYDESLADLKQAIRLWPKNSRACLERGLIYTEIGFYYQAIADFNRAIKINPKYMEAFYHRAEAYEKLTELERALEDYEQAIELKPDYCWSYYRKAIACENTGKRRKAIDAYLSFLERVPEIYTAQISYAHERLYKLQN
jgi:tetratricopeptide (TPR) repeat protein